MEWNRDTQERSENTFGIGKILPRAIAVASVFCAHLSRNGVVERFPSGPWPGPLSHQQNINGLWGNGIGPQPIFGIAVNFFQSKGNGLMRWGLGEPILLWAIPCRREGRRVQPSMLIAQIGTPDGIRKPRQI